VKQGILSYPDKVRVCGAALPVIPFLVMAE